MGDAHRSRMMLERLAAVLLLIFGSALSAAVPTPSITGPIPVTAESGEPFRGTNSQPVAGPGLPLPILVPYDFVEEEYFVSGTVDGRTYRTAILVRKPGDPAKFSGLVAVETVHAAGAIPFWGGAKVWLEGNHGWVGVASQKSALDGHLKRTNAKRYASLDIPAVAEAGTPAGQGSGQDLFSQKIMTQVGMLLKSNPPNGPFRGLRVRHLLMGGSSQTGGTTLRYIQQSHGEAKMADGSPIYDGYAPWEAFPSEPVWAPGSAIIHLVAEGDVMSALMRKRPIVTGMDRDGPNGGYRSYMVAGAAHVGTRGPAAAGLRAFGTLDNLPAGAQVSEFPQNEVFSPAHKFLIDWVVKGVAPPRAKPIVIDNGEIVRDRNGNAVGGVRSPYVDLPTVRYIASIAPQGTLYGLQEPFSDVQLRRMYRSRGAYLAAFDQQIDRMAAEGWLFPDHAAALKREERARAAF